MIANNQNIIYNDNIKKQKKREIRNLLMANENNSRGNIYSANDTLDINELASLNDDITPEFIEQLQNKVAQNASEFIGKPLNEEKDDSELFEEPQAKDIEQTEKPVQKKENIDIDQNIDDNFVKKYKAKLDKTENEIKKIEITEQTKNEDKTNINNKNENNTEPIENLTSGNIIEKPAIKEQVDYNESLDFVDNNVKYSKYVIYVDPENTEFMDSLTVKERKNLINRILREQDDIAITKKRLGLIQTVIKHIIIAIITVSISIPVIYLTINASLEASINNYKRSKTIFKTLYKEKGKIQKNRH